MLVTMLVVDLILGLIGKTMPQMNVMAIGLSLRSVLGMLVVIVGLTLTVRVIRVSVEGFDGFGRGPDTTAARNLPRRGEARDKWAEDNGDKTEAPTPRRRQKRASRATSPAARISPPPF